MSNVVDHPALGRPKAETPSLPTCLEAEGELIGSVLVQPALYPSIAPLVDPDDFANDFHRLVWTVIQQSAEADHPITVSALLPFLPATVEGKATPAYLAHLMAVWAAPASSLPALARMVRDFAHRRLLMAHASTLSEQARAAPARMSAAALLEEFQTACRPIHESDAKSSLATAGFHAATIADELARAADGEVVVETTPTGFQSIDRRGEPMPGDLIVIAGRPGMGKSIVATALARQIARQKVGVLEFPLENGKDQATSRHLADLAFRSRDPVTYGAIMRRKQLTPEDAERVGEAADRLAFLPILIEDSARITPERVRARIQQARPWFAKGGVKLGAVILDHLDFIDSTGRYAGQRVQEIGEIVLALKTIAREEKLVVYLLCQLNRGVEGRDDKRPQLSDLRNSGDIEQVADAVWFLYRPAYYLERDPRVQADPALAAELADSLHVLEIAAAKNRSGSLFREDFFVDVRAAHLSERLK